MLNNEEKQRAFDQFMQLFILPEIEQRKKSGIIPEKFVLTQAQVIFSGDGTKPSIRLNDEAKILAKVELKEGVKKEKGGTISLQDISNVEIMRLPDDEESKYAHISMVRFGRNWMFSFDFRYNKGLARDCLKTAREFYETAKNAFENKKYSPFIDNLFSCIELLAKGELLLMSDPKFRKKSTHKGIQLKYNQYVNIGNAKQEYKSALNKLGGLREAARYLESNFKLSNCDAEKYLSIAEDMLRYLEIQLTRH